MIVLFPFRPLFRKRIFPGPRDWAGRLVAATLATLPCSGLPAAGSDSPPGPVISDTEMLRDLDMNLPGLSELKAAAHAGKMAAVERAYLDYRRAAQRAVWRMTWLVTPLNRGLAPPPPTAPAREQTDPDGELICAHVIRNYFYDFSPRAASMGRDFDWTFNPTPPDDPSFTNEWTWCAISRTEFWMKLADAYARTHNEKYSREWVAELEDFAAKNRMDRAGLGGRVSLWRTLDASKRMADSWPYAYNGFLHSPEFTPEAHWLYLKLIHDHAVCLAEGLSHPERTGNWISSECLGLYTIGALFPELREACGWRQLVIDRIAKEMDRMVLPDGMECELAPSYHVISLNGFRGVLELARLNHLPAPEAFRARIMAMYRALVVVMDQNGMDVPTNDCNGLIDATEEARRGLELGFDPLLEWAASKGRKGRGLPDSTLLPYAGFYALRGGWKPDDLFLFFRAGPAGWGHEHEDMLEVVLRAWNKTLLFDPGSYSYDHSDWRRYATGTASHNTVIVDGKWQHRGPGAIPAARPAQNPWVTTPLFDYVAGTYDGGYQQSVYDPRKQSRPQDWVGPVDRSVSHTRRVLFLRPSYALVLDTLEGSGRHTFDAHFHLAAPAARVNAATQAAFSQNPDGIQLGLYPLAREHLAVDVVQGQREPLLGWSARDHQPIPTVRFRKIQTAPATFATLLYPFRGAAPAIEAQSVQTKGDHIWAARLHTSLETAEIVLTTDGSVGCLEFQSALLGPIAARAAGLVVRVPDRGDGILGGWRLSSYRNGRIAFALDSPAAIVIAACGGHPLVYNGESDPVTMNLIRPFAQRARLAGGAWTEILPGGFRPASRPDWPGSGGKSP